MEANGNKSVTPVHLQRATRAVTPRPQPQAHPPAPGLPHAGAAAGAIAAGNAATLDRAALARRGLEALVDHFHDGYRRFPHLQHLLLKRDPAVEDWRSKVPIRDDRRIDRLGSYQPLACWRDPDTHLFGYLFGETVESGAAVRFGQLAGQAVRWLEFLGYAPADETGAMFQWLRCLHQLASAGHPVVRAPTQIRRRRFIVLPCAPGGPCWYAFLSPGVFEASALALELVLEDPLRGAAWMGPPMAATGSAEPTAATRIGETCLPALDVVELGILGALARRGILMQNEDLAAATGVTSKTVGRRVTRLISAGMVTRVGKRGTHLTPEGLRVAQRLLGRQLSA